MLDQAACLERFTKYIFESAIDSTAVAKEQAR